MKKILPIAAFLFIFCNGYSQSLTFKEITDIYHSLPEEKLSYLHNTKNFKIIINRTPPNVGMMHFLKNEGTPQEEQVFCGSGTLKPDGTFIPHLGYIMADSLYYLTLQKQMEDLNYKLISKKEDGQRWEYHYTNDELQVSFIHINPQYYVLSMYRKDE